jgi:ABC-type antimicrobial peptide transport system permease subunit
MVLLESGLPFLGLGAQPPMTSLGNMVGYGREYITRAPWILLAPSITIVLMTLSVFGVRRLGAGPARPDPRVKSIARRAVIDLRPHLDGDEASP